MRTIFQRHGDSVKRVILLSLLLTLLSCTSKPATVTINDKKVTVELAFSEKRRAGGLMDRTSLKNDSGMIFLYRDPQIMTFWMKNTLIPLSIAFIDSGFRIISIQKMDPGPGTYRSPGLSQFALEVPQGWFERNGVKVGDVVLFSKAVEEAAKKAE